MNPDLDRWSIERLVVGTLEVNCYLVMWEPTRDGVIVDPGDEGDRILRRVRELEMKVAAVVNTHCHGDHIGANAEVVAATGAPLWVGRREADLLTDPWKNMSAPFGFPVTSPPADRLLQEGDVITLGEGVLRVLEAPGHSPGSIILTGDGFALVGDVLFAGSIGRTDFPGGSLESLLRNIAEKIYPLGDNCRVFPGHGPETTVGWERRTNPFLQPAGRLDL